MQLNTKPSFMNETPVTSSKHVTAKDSNRLFPVFLKLEQLRLLIVGGGAVGMEKLNAILHNSPSTAIKLVSITINDEIRVAAERHPGIQLEERAYEPADLDEV